MKTISVFNVMMKSSIAFLLMLILTSCNHNDNPVKLAEFDKDGNQIVYNREVYSEMWLKNKNLKVTVIDTFCINQKSRALADIKKGKLIYFGYHPREFSKMSLMLRKYGIETKEFLGHCLRLGGFDPFCYENEMSREITKRYGDNFIDSIFRIAQKEYVLENPDVEYIENGIDLREKYGLKIKEKH